VIGRVLKRGKRVYGLLWCLYSTARTASTSLPRTSPRPTSPPHRQAPSGPAEASALFSAEELFGAPVTGWPGPTWATRLGPEATTRAAQPGRPAPGRPDDWAPAARSPLAPQPGPTVQVMTWSPLPKPLQEDWICTDDDLSGSLLFRRFRLPVGVSASAVEPPTETPSPDGCQCRPAVKFAHRVVTRLLGKPWPPAQALGRKTRQPVPHAAPSAHPGD
jgi:hypothetical protein